MPRKSEKRRELVAQIVGDSYYEKSDKKNMLAAGLWAISKGTQWEADAKEIILGCCPEFFSETP